MNGCIERTRQKKVFAKMCLGKLSAISIRTLKYNGDGWESMEFKIYDNKEITTLDIVARS